jgi:AraC-like DNA-binding protein
MDRNGQSSMRAEITKVPYRPSVGAPPGVEVLDFPGLLARAGGHELDPYSPKRPDFHILVTVRSGTVTCSVDFHEHRVAAGGWLWVRPGQVHQYRSDLTNADGAIILFQSGFLSPATAEAARIDQRARHPVLIPAGADTQALFGALTLLEDEHRRTGVLPLEAHIDVARHLLAALVLRLAHLDTATGAESHEPATTEAFRRFERAVERDFARTHRVEDYAAALGYSVRTLTRATRASVGCGAKQFLDDRVLLEAKRLLVHTDLSATAIGERLGFPDATVFTKFFHRRANETPTRFKQSRSVVEAVDLPWEGSSDAAASPVTRIRAVRAARPVRPS